MSRHVKDTQLGVTYSKRESDLLIHYPAGHSTKSDGHWLSGIFNMEFEAELRTRGYDPTTLRFTVDIDFTDKHAQEKFPTLYSRSRRAGHERET